MGTCSFVSKNLSKSANRTRDDNRVKKIEWGKNNSINLKTKKKQKKKFHHLIISFFIERI